MTTEDESVDRGPAARDLSDWPRYATARDVVMWDLLPVTERGLLDLAKKHGIGRRLGRHVIFSKEDIARLYDALPTAAEHAGRFVPARPPDSSTALKRALELAQTKRKPR